MKRDHFTISNILQSIEKAWQANPSLRLGQIMLIAVAPSDPCPKLFYIEDKELVSKIESRLTVNIINRISMEMCDALHHLGWAIAVEDDYADLKDYICSRDDGIADAFTRMTVVIMTPDLDPSDAAGVYLHFHFFADPGKIGEDKRAFGRRFRKDNCALLRFACEEIMRQSGIAIGDPSVRVLYRPSNSQCNFGSGKFVDSAYRVEISYFIPA